MDRWSPPGRSSQSSRTPEDIASSFRLTKLPPPLSQEASVVSTSSKPPLPSSSSQARSSHHRISSSTSKEESADETLLWKNEINPLIEALINAYQSTLDLLSLSLSLLKLTASSLVLQRINSLSSIAYRSICTISCTNTISSERRATRDAPKC